MINVIPSNQRYHANHGWLSTYWHFSFGDYYDHNNMHWGALRVFNDDIIQGGGGFPEHPHQDMEIVTVMLDGTLEHRDSLGNVGQLRPGEIQVMSAGRGIEHAEYNASADKPAHLLQLWLLPRHRGNQPRWEQRVFDVKGQVGKLVPVVSGGQIPDTLKIDQDAAIYLSKLPAGKEVSHSSQPGRAVYLFNIAGEITVNGKALKAGDQARVEDETALKIAATKDSELILLDLPKV